MTNTPLHQGDLPNWLIPEDKDVDPDQPDNVHPLAKQDHAQLVAEGERARRELELVAYEAVFERALLDIAAGQPLTTTIEKDYRDISYQRMLAWIHKDENRKTRYYEAQEIGAEVVASQMLTIADADDLLEDVARSTLRINTRKWLLGVWNRKRFGEVKQIEQNVTVDLSQAMLAAQQRADARVIDVASRVINE
jgi:hypothetical protein